MVTPPAHQGTGAQLNATSALGSIAPAIGIPRAILNQTFEPVNMLFRDGRQREWETVPAEPYPARWGRRMSQNFTALQEAIRRRATAVVKGRAGDASCRFEMRLVSEGDAPNGEHGIWCELTGGDSTLMERMIVVQAPVHVTFDCGRISVSFASGFILRKRKLFGGDQVLLGWPGKLEIRERRRSER